MEIVNPKSKQIDPIPKGFSGYEEAAEFWDTHDTMDYPDAFQDIDVKAHTATTNVSKRSSGTG